MDSHSPCHETDDKTFLDMEVSSQRQGKIRWPCDRQLPYITGCDFMPNGDLVLCDANNGLIKLLSSSFEVKGSLNVRPYPWNISAAGSDHCIITFGNGQELQYIQKRFSGC